MGRHKKVSKSHISAIEKWLKEQTEHRRKKKKKLWDETKDTVCPWNVYEEKNGDEITTVIKRNIKFHYKTKKEAKNQPKQTWQRLNRKFYKDYIHSQRELENICIYLNGLDPAEYRAGLRYKAITAYLPNRVLLDFIEKTKAEFLNDEKKDINNRINNFIRCGLNWFQKKSHKVYEWKKYEEKWGQCLLNMADNIEDEERLYEEGDLRSKNTLLRIVWMMNKFMHHLHKEFPHKYPLIEFDPISNSQFKSLEIKRINAPDYREREMINELHWHKIKKEISKDNQLKVLILCWEFGLRRSEALALTVDSMFEDNIFINKQLKYLDFKKSNPRITKPTKTGKSRHIPYDSSQSEMKPEDIYELISTAEPILPDDATKKWRATLDSMNMPYHIHELRHSFAYSIVNSIGGLANRQYSLKECMEILGHESIHTTNKYIKSRRPYSKNKFDISKIKNKKDTA